MLDSTLESTRRLATEIWDVDQAEENSAPAEFLGRCAERLFNIAVVLMYAVLVALGSYTIFQALPREWASAFGNKIWFWVGLVFIVVSALRCGLEVTKLLKRWNVASLFGALLLFDFMFENAPPLFGVASYSVVEQLTTRLDSSALAEFLRKALGL
ncbi:MAG: hypothetical protein QGG36_25515 [Pirellulaceae bacterium]|jgi:hypothetical protein|nr:hypothetical protein [Pirellulaceae bacterium]MDP7019181.1 hypothetical protein [Pirellulaceae bacterium]